METGTVYIHYGDDQFRIPDPIKNVTCFTKPDGGFWASRKDDPLGWKSWCESEDYQLDRLDRHFLFTLKENAKVLEINCTEQLEHLPQNKPTYLGFTDGYTFYLDFQKLAKEYDAIEVTNIGQLYWSLYGWDCNSILIMNPEVVEIL